MGFNFSGAARGASDALQRQLAERYARTLEAQQMARQIARDEEEQRRYTREQNLRTEDRALAAMHRAEEQELARQERERRGRFDAMTVADWESRRAREQQEANQRTQDRAVQAMAVAGVKGKGYTPYDAQLMGLEQGVEIPDLTSPEEKERQALEGYKKRKLIDLQYRPADSTTSTERILLSPDGKRQQVVRGAADQNTLLREGWTIYDPVAARQAAAQETAQASKDNRQAIFLADALRMAEQLQTMPGKAGAVGAKGPMSLFGLMDKPKAGSEAGDFTRIFDTLISRLTVPELQKMAGTGPVSDREFATLAAGATALNRDLREGTWDTTLAALIQELKDKYRKAAGAEYQAPTFTMPTNPGVTVLSIDKVP